MKNDQKNINQTVLCLIDRLFSGFTPPISGMFLTTGQTFSVFSERVSHDRMVGSEGLTLEKRDGLVARQNEKCLE